MPLNSWQCLMRVQELEQMGCLAGSAGNIHGLACWFDVAFEGSLDTRHLSTAPGLPVTHW